MKKIYVTLIAVLVILSMPITIYAASGNKYKLDDLGMSIEIPSEYVVFTRNISSNDPNLSAYGLNKTDLLDTLKAGNIYLNAWDEDVNFEILVTMIDSPLGDFNQYSDTTLNTLASSFESGYAASGITVEKYEIYQHSQAKFIKIYISQSNGYDMVYGLQYYTVYDDRAINVTMQSYSGKINSTKETVLKSIVDTVKFDSEPVKMDEGPETASFMYRDHVSRITFYVPENWSMTDFDKEKEFLDAKFTSNKEPGMSILYGSQDLWSAMPESEKKGLSRADIDNSMFTKSDIADAAGISVSNISMVTYGEKEYYKYSSKTSSSAYGLDLSATMTCLTRIENGYMYMYQFSGDSQNKYYKDFEKLLESVSYPSTETTIALPKSTSSSSSDSIVLNIILSILLTVAVYSAPIFIYRFAVKKEPVEQSKAKKITIIYAICAFLVMSVIIVAINGGGAAGGAILLWSWINYKVLISGKKKETDSLVIQGQNNSYFVSSIPTEESRTPKESFKPVDSDIGKRVETIDVIYCYKCGTKLNANVKFCHVCGTKIIKGGD